MFNWEAAEEILYTISKEQITRFLGGAKRDDVYGIGFFCDPIEGVMLVANTRSCHDSSFGAYEERFGATDEETFRWDIGNWEYPAGLAPCTTEEQGAFDAAWMAVAGPLSESHDGRDQALLEGLCVRILKRLCEENIFSAASGLEGFMVLGPDDSSENVLAKKDLLDDVLPRQG